MARKVIDFNVDSPGRDQGKVFRITEMPASQAERWAMRAFMAMGAAGVEVPESVQQNGVAGLAGMTHKLLEGVTAIPFELAEPLLDEMMDCVQAMPNPDDKSITRRLVESDIEEVSTRFRLRLQILKLHSDFSGAGDTSTSGHPSA